MSQTPGVKIAGEQVVARTNNPRGAERYELDPDPADAMHWGTALTLMDLGALTARWLEGDISYLPGYGAAGPDPETTGLVPFLAAANRAGYVTSFSQPGNPIDDRWCQRAAVDGFCDEQTAERIADGLAGTDLVVLALFPGAIGEVTLAVTMNGGRPHTWVGNPLDAENIVHCYGESCQAKAIEALCLAWQVCVFDPVWGRNDLLWAELGTVLGIAAQAERRTPAADVVAGEPRA